MVTTLMRRVSSDGGDSADLVDEGATLVEATEEDLLARHSFPVMR